MPEEHIRASQQEIRDRPCLMVACPAQALRVSCSACNARSGEVCIDRLEGGRHKTGPHQERVLRWANLTELERAILKVKEDDAHGKD